jgi:hypothetical protein
LRNDFAIYIPRSQDPALTPRRGPPCTPKKLSAAAEAHLAAVAWTLVRAPRSIRWRDVHRRQAPPIALRLALCGPPASLSPGRSGEDAVVEPTVRPREGECRSTIPGHPEIFVIGDLAYREQDGKPPARVAPVAMQQNACGVRHRRPFGESRVPKPFRWLG